MSLELFSHVQDPFTQDLDKRPPARVDSEAKSRNEFQESLSRFVITGAIALEKEIKDVQIERPCMAKLLAVVTRKKRNQIKFAHDCLSQYA